MEAEFSDEDENPTPLTKNSSYNEMSDNVEEDSINKGNVSDEVGDEFNKMDHGNEKSEGNNFHFNFRIDEGVMIDFEGNSISVSEIFKNMDENFKIDDFDNLSPGYGPCCLCYKVCRIRQHLKGTHKIKNDGFLNILVGLIKFMGLQISSQHALEKLYSLCKVCGSLVRNSRIKNHLRKEHLFNDVISKEKTFLSMKKFFSNNTSDSKMDTTDAEQKIAEEIYFNEINGKGSEDKNFKQAEKEIYCYLNFLGERNFTLKQ
ncbi:hypothetical protein Avbf_04519, partial [Armadillidium vulgare]